MPILTNTVDVVTRRLPKVVSPKAHAIIDYITIGTFFVAGALFWRKNKRAALGSLICGSAELAVNLLTDYPGGVSSVINFPTHGKIDVGLAAMAATMPEFLAFPKETERHFFLSQAGVIIVAANLTDFAQRRVKLYPVPKSHVS
jgi:hypothetical protein